MIYGIGTDLVELKRIGRILEQYGDGFAEKILNTDELGAYATNRQKIRFLAKRFAAKEAIAKALGTGFRGFWFTDISIAHDAVGRPLVALHGQAQQIADNAKINRWHLSISDEKTLASAYAIAECLGAEHR